MKRINLVFAVLSLIPFAGCGGGSQRETTGRLSVNVKWPAPSRLIPAASNSIKVEILDGANRVAHQTINRPATQATFTGLPVANLVLKATAYPEPPGDPVSPGITAQATGTTVVAVQAGANPPVTVTMSTTIDRIEVTSTSLVVNGPSQTLTATARDAASNLVLLTPGVLEWDSSNDSIATVTNAGVVSPVGPGLALISVRDPESNKTGSAPVTVSNEGGTANVTVNNPPTGARSLRIEIANGTLTLASRNLAWTTGATISDTFTGIPAGSHTVTATAFSQDSGGGSALGTASGGITIPSLGSGSVTLNLNSLVASIALIPPGPNVLQGQGVTLTVQARDGSATPIATLASAAFNWTITPNPVGAATVNAGGVVSTTAAGSAVVRATDPRTGAFAETTVNIGSSSASAGGVVR